MMAIASTPTRRRRTDSGWAAAHARATFHIRDSLRSSIAESGCPYARLVRVFTSTAAILPSRAATMSISPAGHRQLRSRIS